MMLYLSLILVLLYGVMCFQDFKYRGISWYLFPVAAVGSIFLGLELTGWQDVGVHFLWNVAFVILQLSLLSIYFSIKKKRFVNIVNSYLGIADILLLLLFAMSFSPLNFIIFYCINLCLAATISLLLVLIKQDRSFKIPLAGIMVWPMIFCLLYPKVTVTMQSDAILSVYIMNYVNGL